MVRKNSNVYRALVWGARSSYAREVLKEASQPAPAGTLAAEPVWAEALLEVVALMRGKRVLVLGGAGMSTESGIPDYRGPQTGQQPRNPMRFQQFVASDAARKRYWARSFVGWQRVAAAAPNAGHRALCDLETAGPVMGVITQNVDGLHQAAGSRRVLELHGSLAAVRCLGCAAVSSRRRLQQQLLALNEGTMGGVGEVLEHAPDGDAELSEGLEAEFRVPACAHCGGVLKPDVVFFGENVPKARVTRAYELLEGSDVLLVVGSSLTVFSGYRFVVRAARDNKPVVILNQGDTRGDPHAACKLEGPLGDVLPALAGLLT